MVKLSNKEKKMNIYEQTIKKFDLGLQISMMVEECAELIVELQHFRRGRGSGLAVCGEIADVEIMCAQMRVIFGSTRVDRVKVLKLQRLKELIGEERI